MPDQALPTMPTVAASSKLQEEVCTLIGQADFKKPLTRHLKRVHKDLSTGDEFEVSDRLISFLTSPYEDRVRGLTFVYGLLELVKASIFQGDTDYAQQKFKQAESLVEDVHRAIQKGPHQISEHSHEGAIGKRDRYEPLKDELARLLVTKRPFAGWKSRRAAALELREDLLKHNEVYGRPLVPGENFHRTLADWMSKDMTLKDIYNTNSARLLGKQR